jgi:hypothetical protein
LPHKAWEGTPLKLARRARSGPIPAAAPPIKSCFAMDVAFDKPFKTGKDTLGDVPSAHVVYQAAA